MPATGTPVDAMIARLEREIEERDSFLQGVIRAAQDAERDLTDNERELTVEARKRIESCQEQLETLDAAKDRTARARQRAIDVQREMSRMRTEVDKGPVEYRSAGAWALDSYKASLGDREANQRLEIYYRAAAHQKTTDNLGVVPDPIVGNVINFIDAARPIVSFIGTQPMPSATWHRPKVTQGTSVGPQGAAGGAADEKAELVSQKMTITRVTGNAVTYGGYVNLSRQNLDFSTPQTMDIVINDLAARYAIATEVAAATALDTGGAVAVALGTTESAIKTAIWAAAADVYTAVRGQGRLFLAIAPDRLEVVGPLFNPVNPQNAQSPGFTAGSFGQGVMGTISGIPVIMSAGIAANKSVLASTASIEFYEQRVGTLQVTEPSVMGLQIAYAGYFSPLTVEVNGKQKFLN